MQVEKLSSYISWASKSVLYVIKKWVHMDTAYVYCTGTVFNWAEKHVITMK